MPIGRKRRSGLTLIEVVIACAILGLSLGVLVPSFVMQQKGVVYANNRLIAMHGARADLEALMARKYYDSALDIGAYALSNGNYVVTENAGIKTIVLTRRWVEPLLSRTQSLSLTTCMSYAIHR